MTLEGCSVRQVSWLPWIRGIIRIHDETWGRSLGILDLLSNSSACFVAVDRDKRVWGYCFVEEDKTRGFFELQDIAVAPNSRGSGIGRELMHAAMETCPRIKLMTRAGRPQGVVFFERLGFEREQYVENYYDVGDDALRMCWTRRGGSSV